MKKISTTLLTAALLGVGMMGAAHATNIFVNLPLPTDPGDTGPLTASFADTIKKAGSFTDDFIFAAPPLTSTDTFTAAAGSGITFTGVELKYFVPTSGPAPSFTSTLTSTSITASTPMPITVGTYELEITGTATAGAKYTGSISALITPQVAPVPEPETWALMLLGLGATGAFVRRRRQQHDV